MEKIRLDKFLASQLNLSRSDAKALLRSGSVTVNGSAVGKGEFTLDAAADTVPVNGTPVSYKKHLYIMMHKPAGVISAS